MTYASPRRSALLALSLGLATANATANTHMTLCEVNGIDACETDGVALPPSPVLTLRGYAYDLDSRKRPTGSGFLILRNEQLFRDYRVPIQQVEPRPDVMTEVIESIADLGWVLSPADYGMINAGFIARVLTAPLDEGIYTVVRGSIDLTGNGHYTFDYRDTGIQLPRFSVQKSDDTAIVSVVGEDGAAYPLTLETTSTGEMSVTGYPALPEGNYTLKAGGNLGLASDEVAFQYERPDINVTASIPIVQNFPGVDLTVRVDNPLTDRPLELNSLSARIVNTEPLQEVLDNLEQSGNPINPDVIPLVSLDGSWGEYRLQIAKKDTAPTDEVLHLYIDAPDAPDIVLRLLAWDPLDAITVASDRVTVPRLVENINVEASLANSNRDTCNQVRVYKDGDRLWSTSNYVCALKWNNLHDGFESWGSRTSMTGPVKNNGSNVFSYTPGVIASNYMTGKPQFYPAYIDGAITIEGTEPPPIDLSFSPTRDHETFTDLLSETFPQDHFVIAYGNRETWVGEVGFNAPHRGITTKLTFPDGSEEVYTTRNTAGRISVRFNADALWQEYPVQVESRYTLHPDGAPSTLDLNFRGVPTYPVLVLHRPTQEFHTEAPVILNGSMGTFNRGQIVFDPSTMGQWNITIRDSKTGDPIGTSATVQEDGSFAVDLGVLTNGHHSLYAEASLVDDTNTTVPMTLESRPQSLYVYYGGPLDGSLTVRNSSGPVPFREHINLRFNDSDAERSYSRLVGNIQWESRDGHSGDWVPVIEQGSQVNSQSFAPLFTDAGVKQFRAKTVNQYSGMEFVTGPVTLQAYAVPSLEVSDPGFVIVGEPVTLSAQSDADFDVDYEWELPYSRAPYENASSPAGQSFTFTPTQNATYLIKVKAKSREAPDTAQAFAEKSVYLRVVNPLEYRASIEGPRVMESGKSYRFTATINNRYPSSNYTLRGYWSLPDGTTVDGTTLDYTPAPNDSALSFYTYVEGRPEETSVTTKTFSVWTYQWPEDWQITLTPKYLDVPAVVYYRLNALDVTNLPRATNNETLYYNWILPDGVERRSSNDDSGTLIFTQDGEYQIGVEISDERGNLVHVTSNRFTIAPARQVELEGRIAGEYQDSAGDYILYAPGQYMFDVDITSVPRGDRISRRSFYMNGEYVDDFYRFIRQDILEPGPVEVTFLVETELGNVGEFTETYTFIPPPTPSCQMTYMAATSGRYLYLMPECQVENGRIRSYEWTYDYDGVESNSTRDMLAIFHTDCEVEKLQNISLKVTSNVGGTVTYDNIPYTGHCTSPQ